MAAPMAVDGDKSQQEESSALASIFAELKNDVQLRLEASFVASGRGRRPDPPQLPCTNGLLLQFYAMKVESEATWDTVQEWLGKMFPKVERKRFRKIVQGSLRNVEQCVSFDERQVFYSKEIDLQFIGEECSKIGITRETFADPSLLGEPVEKISNGVVHELSKFCKSESIGLPSLFSFLQILLTDVSFNLKAFKSASEKLSDNYKKLSRNSSRNTDAIDLLKENFVCRSTKKKRSTSPLSQPKPVKHPKLSHSQVLKLQGEISNLKAYTEELELQNSALQEKISQTTCELSNSQSILKKSESENLKLREKLQSQLQKISEKENELKSIKEECAAMRQSNYYNRLKRRERKLNEKEATLEKCSTDSDKSIIADLKKQIKSLQTLLSNQRSICNEITKNNKETEKRCKEMKSRLSVMESELLAKEDQQLETRGPKRQFLDNVRKCVIQLQGENGVAAKHCGAVIQTVAKWLFDYEVDMKDLPSTSSAINMADEGHILAKYQVAEAMLKSDRWDLHSDGTSRDHKKIVGQQVTTGDGQSLSAGFSSVCVEDTSTLLDVAINLLRDLADLHAENQEAAESTFQEMLRKMHSTMSDRASKMKTWNRELDKYRKNYQYSTDKPDNDLHALHCNAHFLLGLSNQCDQVLSTVEKQMEERLGRKLGRANLAKFAHFKTSETNSSRFIRTACDILGPRGDEKNGCRHEWEAHLKKLNKKSHVTSFRSNRFNNYFQGAATLFHHHEDIVEFITEFKSDANLKIQSVLADAQSPDLMVLVRILGILYFKITGPYWQLLRSETNYAEFYVYVQRMLSMFQEWAADPSPLLNEHAEPLFPEFAIPLGEAGSSLFAIQADYDNVATIALQEIMKGLIQVTTRQLSDFLPEGKYGQKPTPEQLEGMRHSKLTNLIGEYVFGDLDYYQKSKRHTTLHHYSTLNMLKRNQTMSHWMKTKSPMEQASLMKLARKKGSLSRLADRRIEQEVVQQTQKRLEENRMIKEKKMERRRSRKNKVVEDVVQQGGLCKNSRDIKKLLDGKTEKQQLEALKCQFRYLRDILSIPTKQIFKDATVQNLQANLETLLQANKDCVEKSRPFQHVSPIPNDVNDSTDEQTSDDDAEEHPEYQPDTDNGEHDEPNYEFDHFGSFSFVRQGSSVAVAYDEDIFIGQIVSIESEKQGTVQFLERLSGNRFRWPACDDLATVDQKYVVDSDFDIIPQGRTVNVPTFPAILKQFQAYQKQFM